MRRLAPIIASGLIAGGLLLNYSKASSGGGSERWLDTIRSKGWVTAFAESSDPTAVPAAMDRIAAFIGGSERIVYRAHVMDRELGWPVVSPDGTRVAFLKSDGLRRQLFTMTIIGSELRALVAMPPSETNLKGVLINSPVAWTHDNRSLALVARLDGESPPSARRLGGPPKSLWRVNASTGDTTRLRELEFKIAGEVVAGNTITAQAWAPDGRRLVYSTSDFHAVIHDTATGAETDLGPGFHPTWSPNGQFIAVRVPNVGKGQPGDYVVIDAHPPHRRTVLLSNAPTLFSWGGPRYLGDALWLPDSDGVFVYRYRRDVGVPHIVRRTTGEVTKMPFTFTTHSWGGPP